MIGSPPAHADAAHSAQEWDFFNRLNAERQARGIAPVQMATNIRTVARNWSGYQAANCPTTCHNPNFSSQMPAGWVAVGENVGYGSDVATIHNCFMTEAYPSCVATPGEHGHRDNILNPAYNYVGIGVSANGGSLYVTEDFGKYPCCQAVDSQPPPPSAWPNGWAESLGGVMAVGSGPSVSSRGPGRLDVFVRGNNNILYHRWNDGGGWLPGGGQWEPLEAPNPSTGSGMVSDPDAVSWDSNRIDVFARGTDNAMWHKWWVNGIGWYPWEKTQIPTGGVLGSGPTVASWGPGRLDAFVRGTDGQLYHAWYDGRWNGWKHESELAGTLASDPAAVSWGPNRIDVFVEGTEPAPTPHQLYHAWYDGQWHPFEPRGGAIAGSPAASSRGSGRLDVFVRGTDAATHHTAYESTGWGGFEPLSAPSPPSGYGITGAPESASWSGIRMDVFARGTDNALWHTWYP
jgi:hypothetical protein